MVVLCLGLWTKKSPIFKSRRKFADDIVRRILNRDRPTLILYGPRRCGKTSFLYKPLNSDLYKSNIPFPV